MSIMEQPLILASYKIANVIKVPAFVSCLLVDVDLELKQCPAQRFRHDHSR